LTNPARGPEDQQAWEKALRDFKEAQALDLKRTPGAGIHKSYYAMFQTARAVLLRIDGEKAATRHGGVIGRFGQIAKSRDDDALLSAGRDLNRVYEERIESDYDTQAVTTEEDARECLAKAENFLRQCADKFGFNFN